MKFWGSINDVTGPSERLYVLKHIIRMRVRLKEVLEILLRRVSRAIIGGNPGSNIGRSIIVRETGELGLHRLSDQILIDKWAMIWRGFHADPSTKAATEGLLNRALRIGQSSSTQVS